MSQAPKQDNNAKSDLPLYRMIPNILTTLALSAGLTAIPYAIAGHYQIAVICVVFAGIFDTLDGRAARLLRSSSAFGVQFDSLSDVIAFGVAPAIILHQWMLYQLPSGLGWLAALSLTVCTALRLARFNVAQEDPGYKTQTWRNGFFTGLASPAAAGLALLPLMLSFELWPAITEIRYGTELLALWVVVIAMLMISNWPTFSFKGSSISRRNVQMLLLLIAVCAFMTWRKPWLTLPIIGMIYGLSLLLSPIPYYRRYKRAGEAAARDIDEYGFQDATEEKEADSTDTSNTSISKK